MARPYHFAPDSSRSPLDQRSASGFTAGQAPSFKTNVNRAKTKRWVEAKSYTYDGDDWGDYDDDDQYGVEENQSLAPPKPTGLRQKGQTLGSSPASSSHSSDHLNRSNSYERGDEQRAYLSGSQAPRTMVGTGKSYEGDHPEGNDDSQPVLDYQKQRNFSPSVLPQPLYANPVPTTDETPRKFPARKSSLIADEVPVEQEPHSDKDSASSGSDDQRKPAAAVASAPFIRPADIYKRMEAEREKERQSLDSQRSGSERSPRPAIGGTRSSGQRSRSRSGSPSKARDYARVIQGGGLESMPAPKSAYESKKETAPTSAPAIGLSPNAINPRLVTSDQSDGKATSNTTQTAKRSSFLPQVHRLSGFGDDLWSSADADTQGNDFKTPSDQKEASVPEHKDVVVGEQPSQEDKPSVSYQAVVRQAFDRPDRSALQTPLSAQESVDSHGVSRSNTDSTAGISPILSRMPSNSAGAKARTREVELRAIATPAIGEESDQVQSSTSLTSSTPGQRIPRKPASRAASGEYDAAQITNKTGLEGAGVDSTNIMSEDDKTPNEAMPGSETPLTVDTEQNNRNSRIAARISDLSANSSKSPEVAVPRAESPTKGRVRDLAGRFNDGSSKRESSTSPSRSSVISLGKSKDDTSSNISGQRNSAIWGISSDQNDSKRPNAQREASFRPHIPGRWESYSTTAGTPTPYESDSNKGYLSGADAVGSRKVPESSPLAQMKEEDDDDAAIDLTPKKAKNEEESKAGTGPDTLQLASLSQAGKAVGEAIKASVGLGSDSKQGGVDNDRDQVTETRSSTGTPTDEVHQPAEPRRSTSSASSSQAHLPPVNDISESSDRKESDLFRAPEPLSVAGARRSKQTQSKILRRTEEKSVSDQDSDRLREEIEQTLSPAKSSESVGEEKSKSPQMPSHASPVETAGNRESSVFPSEYDSYWASADAPNTGNQPLTSPLGPIIESTSDKPEKDKESATRGPSAVQELPSYTVSGSKPKLSTRFSWETDHSSVTKAGAVNDKTEIDSDAPFKNKDSQSNLQPQFVEPSPEPPAKDTYEGVKSEKRSSADGELQSQMMSFGESSDPKIQTLSSSLGKEATPEVPPKASPTAKAAPGLPSALDGGTDISDSASPNEASNISSKPLQQPSGRTISGGLPSNQPANHLTATWNPPPFREILAIKSANERIQTCDRYRNQLISLDSGLDQWIRSTIAMQPEHSKMVNNPQGQPLSVSTSFPTTSVQQHVDNAPRLQSASTAGPASANPVMYNPSPQSAGVAGSGVRMSSQQVQARGKDLLHSANVFGGKASTISKGLFAKGRSRFKGGSSEKARSPSAEGAHEHRRSLSFPTYRRSSRTSSHFMAHAGAERADDDDDLPISLAPPIPSSHRSGDGATSSATTSTAVHPPTDLATNHTTTPRGGVATAAPSTPPTQAESTAETRATTPIRKAATTPPTRLHSSKRVRNFSPFRRRRSSNNNNNDNNSHQSKTATGVPGDEAYSNKEKDNNNNNKRSIRPGGASRTRSFSGGLLLLGRQLRFNQFGQSQVRQQQKGDQEQGQMAQGQEEREFKERRRHSLFALPRSMSASNTQDTRKTTRAQMDALSQPPKQSQPRVHTYAYMNGKDDPWGWGEPPAEAAMGGQIGSGSGRRLMSDSSAVTVPARLGVLPSPPEAMFPAGVRERMVSPVEGEKPEVREKKEENKEEEREGGGKEKGEDVNSVKFSDKAHDGESGSEQKGAADQSEGDGDFTMSGVWVKGQSIASPVKERGNKGTGNEYVQSVAGVQQQSDSQSFLGDLEGSKSRYDGMDESVSDLRDKMAALKSEERVEARDAGTVVLGSDESSVSNSSERVSPEKTEQPLEGNSMIEPPSSNPFSDSMDSVNIINREPMPIQSKVLTVANPDFLQSESLRSPTLPLPQTNSAMTSPALSFHTATDGSISQFETDLYGREQGARSKEIRDKEEPMAEEKQKSQDLVSQSREDVARSRIGHQSVSPETEKPQTDREAIRPTTNLPKNGKESLRSNVASPAPKPIFFKTNSTYYKPAGISAPSAQAQASRPSNSSERSVEKGQFVTSTESNDTRPGLKPKVTASDIFKALKRASGGTGARNATFGREKRRASIAGGVPIDPRRSPDAPPVPAINPAFFENLHASDRQTGPRRAVTDSIVLNQDKSSKRKSLTRVGDLLRRFSSKGPAPTDAKLNNANDSVPTTPTKKEKRRSLVSMNRRSYTGGLKDKSQAVPANLGLDKRRASMPASVPTQGSWQSDLSNLPAENGRFGSSQYWEKMYRTSGLELYQVNKLAQQKRQRPQQRQTSEGQVQVNSKFSNLRTKMMPESKAGSSQARPRNPRENSGQGNAKPTTEAADAYSNVMVQGHAVTPPRHSSAMMPADSSGREMTPLLPTPPQAPALNLVPNAVPAPSIHSVSTASLTPAPLMRPLTSSDIQKWRQRRQQQEQQRLASELDAGANGSDLQKVSQVEKSPVMHAASYPGMEWVPDFYDES